MTNEYKNIFQNPEIKQNMLILSGKKNQKNLSPEIIKQIQRDYISMYYSLAAINWCRGGTLGMAWQKALEQMESFVNTKMKNPENSVGEKLMEFHVKHKHDMSKEIMMGQHSNDKLNLKPESVKQWVEFATKRFREKMSDLNNLYKQYMPEKNMENDKSKSFDIAKQNAQNLMQQMLIQQMLKQRAT